MSGHFKVLDSALPLSPPTIKYVEAHKGRVLFLQFMSPSAPPDTWGLILHENNKEQWELDCYQCQWLT
jgi:hypothetical protein